MEESKSSAQEWPGFAFFLAQDDDTTWRAGWISWFRFVREGELLVTEIVMSLLKFYFVQKYNGSVAAACDSDPHVSLTFPQWFWVPRCWNLKIQSKRELESCMFARPSQRHALFSFFIKYKGKIRPLAFTTKPAAHRMHAGTRSAIQEPKNDSATFAFLPRLLPCRFLVAEHWRRIRLTARKNWISSKDGTVEVQDVYRQLMEIVG